MSEKKRLLIFGGTTEAREFLELGLPAICCVTTDYGARLLENIENVEVVVGRLKAEEMESLMRKREITCVIDATHPYAKEATANIKAACKGTSLPLLRLLRDEAEDSECDVKVSSCGEAAEFLNGAEGNALLTVGSKELADFTSVRDYGKRLFARVLPSSEVIKKCEKLGFDAGHIIAVQGPFSVRFNEELLLMTEARYVVTKNSGSSGGVESKLMAARNIGVEVIMVERPKECGATVQESYEWARGQLGLP